MKKNKFLRGKPNRISHLAEADVTAIISIDGSIQLSTKHSSDLVYHSGKTNIFFVAPPRSGKGVMPQKNKKEVKEKSIFFGDDIED